MMLGFSSDEPEKYKDYRNRTKQQHMDKLRKQLWAIRDCSLKPEDKKQLKVEMKKLLEDFNMSYNQSK